MATLQELLDEIPDVYGSVNEVQWTNMIYEGWVYLRAYLAAYEASRSIYIDIKPVVA